jgi:hypothetical protein
MLYFVSGLYLMLSFGIICSEKQKFFKIYLLKFSCTTFGDTMGMLCVLWCYSISHTVDQPYAKTEIR